MTKTTLSARMILTAALAAFTLPLAAQTIPAAAPQTAETAMTMAAHNDLGTGMNDSALGAIRPSQSSSIYGPKSTNVITENYQLPAGLADVRSDAVQQSFRVTAETSTGPAQSISLLRPYSPGFAGDFEEFRPRQSLTVRF